MFLFLSGPSNIAIPFSEMLPGSETPDGAPHDTDGKAPSHPEHREIADDEGHETGIWGRMALDQQPDTDGDRLTNQQACEEYKQ